MDVVRYQFRTGREIRPILERGSYMLYHEGETVIVKTEAEIERIVGKYEIRWTHNKRKHTGQTGTVELVDESDQTCLIRFADKLAIWYHEKWLEHQSVYTPY